MHTRICSLIIIVSSSVTITIHLWRIAKECAKAGKDAMAIIISMLASGAAAAAFWAVAEATGILK